MDIWSVQFQEIQPSRRPSTQSQHLSSYDHLLGLAGGEGGTVVLGVAVSSVLLLLPRGREQNKSQTFFCPHPLSTGLSDQHWLLPHQDIWASPQTHNKLITSHCKSRPSAPYLDFIASEEFHFNGLLQYSLSVHVSSCLDYLNRKNTFRRARG